MTDKEMAIEMSQLETKLNQRLQECAKAGVRVTIDVMDVTPEEDYPEHVHFVMIRMERVTRIR